MKLKMPFFKLKKMQIRHLQQTTCIAFIALLLLYRIM